VNFWELFGELSDALPIAVAQPTASTALEGYGNNVYEISPSLAICNTYLAESTLVKIAPYKNSSFLIKMICVTQPSGRI